MWYLLTFVYTFTSIIILCEYMSHSNKRSTLGMILCFIPVINVIIISNVLDMPLYSKESFKELFRI